jgi:hypothetical protein
MVVAKSPTVYDVAERAGVSIACGSADVRSQRRRIMDVQRAASVRNVNGGGSR